MVCLEGERGSAHLSVGATCSECGRVQFNLYVGYLSVLRSE
jgi:hypothetical protein